jgi:hypothetical protein
VRYLRVIGLCFIAAAVMVGATAGGASAKLPEWGQCEPTESGTGGKYDNAVCTLPLKKVSGSYPGAYEWHPLSNEEHSALRYEEENGPQPVDEATITLANGEQIKCEGLVPETQIVLNGPHTITKAPYFEFGGCHTGEGECHSVDSVAFSGIGSENAWRDGIEDEPGTWTGTTSFVEGKESPDPVVGIVYRTERPRERFLQQIVCEGQGIRGMAVGGKKSGEELTTEITPVNTMSASFTADLRQSEGVQLPATLEGHRTKPVEVLVNAERWETIGFEATMLFPEASLGFGSAYNHKRHELELKATP